MGAGIYYDVVTNNVPFDQTNLYIRLEIGQ